MDEKAELEKLKHENRLALAEARKELQVEVMKERQEAQWETRDRNSEESLRLAVLREEEATRRQLLTQRLEAVLLPERLRSEFEDHERREKLRIEVREKELGIEEPYKLEERLHELNRIREEATKQERAIFAQCLANVYEMLVQHHLGVDQLGALDEYVRDAMAKDT